MTTKYIIANISLPLKINEDGTYFVMSENIELKFSAYEGDLLSSRSIDKTTACSELTQLMSSLLEDVKNTKNPVENCRGPNIKKNNITFKSSIKKHNVKSKYTMKNH